MKHQPTDYPAGFFTELVYAHNFPPRWQSQIHIDPSEQLRKEAAVRGRATALANGHTGSVRNGLSKKSAGVMPSVEKARVAG
jgi:hypothetical protein